MTSFIAEAHWALRVRAALPGTASPADTFTVNLLSVWLRQTNGIKPDGSCSRIARSMAAPKPNKGVHASSIAVILVI
eukprot:CAMPEP_0204290836 /NCGR_PEP_ID=MMETSP0468-20130131/61354_1 /ASSEMBLY_ACC=CAM_ASM_000383 /TAXON_ID=2969 /ORGANISM="Oxyrrhis marina" /LENGTH=76 /DNA_ID=CAMNT_0051269093 /DNA_START=312 /DNA_END=542 /DNA_ORIENTATION=+